MSEKQEIRFEHLGAADRLDRVVTAMLNVRLSDAPPSRSQLKELIEAGMVTVDGDVVCKAGAVVKPGAVIRCTIPPRVADEDLEPYDRPLHILHEDDSIIVVDKPAALTMHPGAGNRAETLVNALHHYWMARNTALAGEVGRLPRAGIVHRLDRDTSGVVVVAKTRRALESLIEQFSARTVGRRYVALARISPRSTRFSTSGGSGITLDSQGRATGTIEGAIGRHPTARVKMAVLTEGGRRAVTHWTLLERFEHGAVLELRLETGRTHQIRVHLAHLGAPLVGDPVYGDDRSLPRTLASAASAFGRQALHARWLEFLHPATGERVQFSSPLPADLERLLTIFRATPR